MATATKARPAKKASAKRKPAAKKATVAKKAPAKKKVAPLPEQINETHAQMIERGSCIVDEFAKFGVQANLYARPPSGVQKTTFILSQTNGIPGSLLIWPGANTINLEFHGDAEKRQVVLNVDEPKRVLKFNTEIQYSSDQQGTYDYDTGIWKPNSEAKTLSSVRDHIKTNWRRYINIGIPAGSRLGKVTVTRVGDVPVEGEHRPWSTFKVEFEVQAPASSFSFLTGIDESSLFVALLPSKATSVEHAHKLLRPKGVTSKAVRQGEWFFQPATRAERELLLDDGELPNWVSQWDRNKPKSLERQSSHRAEQLLRVGLADGTTALFAKGAIKDVRSGHHSDLQLDEWHRVVRNREVVQEVAANSTVTPRRWD